MSFLVYGKAAGRGQPLPLTGWNWTGWPGSACWRGHRTSHGGQHRWENHGQPRLMNGRYRSKIENSRRPTWSHGNIPVENKKACRIQMVLSSMLVTSRLMLVSVFLFGLYSPFENPQDSLVDSQGYPRTRRLRNGLPGALEERRKNRCDLTVLNKLRYTGRLCN